MGEEEEEERQGDSASSEKSTAADLPRAGAPHCPCHERRRGAADMRSGVFRMTRWRGVRARLLCLLQQTEPSLLRFLLEVPTRLDPFRLRRSDVDLNCAAFDC